MFGSKIKLDKELLSKVKHYSDLAGYSSVEEFITHALERLDAGHGHYLRVASRDAGAD